MNWYLLVTGGIDSVGYPVGNGVSSLIGNPEDSPVHNLQSSRIGYGLDSEVGWLGDSGIDCEADCLTDCREDSFIYCQVDNGAGNRVGQALWGIRRLKDWKMGRLDKLSIFNNQLSMNYQ